jgi:ADP-heptose:LPS heptosyltransferase
MLTSLIQQLNGLDELIEEGKPLPSFDYQCPLMSLPHAFKTEVSTIPHSFQYFYPPLDKINQIKQEIEIIKARKKLLIGISWHSIAINTGTSRSIKLKQLIENLALKQVQYINLQYGDTEKEIDEIKNELGIEIFQSSINNYDDMAGLSALIDICDVIISIDNTTAHLAGALGKNTKIMLPFNPDFRWMLDRDDSPWYPSVKLYRQEKYGDWGAVFEKLRVDLEKLVTV